MPAEEISKLLNIGERYGRNWHLQMIWPMFVHPFKQINEPLARDVIAENDKKEDNSSNCAGRNVVHVGIPKNIVNATSPQKPKVWTHFSPFWRLPTRSIISDRPQNVPPTPVYRKPLENLVLA